MRPKHLPPSHRPDAVRARYYARKAAGYCRNCKAPRKEVLGMCERHHAIEIERSRIYRARKGNEYWRQRYLRYKKQVIDHYGGKCECCNESELVFLALDHIHGGGT